VKSLAGGTVGWPAGVPVRRDRLGHSGPTVSGPRIAAMEVPPHGASTRSNWNRHISRSRASRCHETDARVRGSVRTHDVYPRRRNFLPLPHVIAERDLFSYREAPSGQKATTTSSPGAIFLSGDGGAGQLIVRVPGSIQFVDAPAAVFALKPRRGRNRVVGVLPRDRVDRAGDGVGVEEGTVDAPDGEPHPAARRSGPAAPPTV
jgi:hypothetical protein